MNTGTMNILKKALTTAIIIMAMAVTGCAKPPAAGDRIMVLGFESGLVNDVQARILREMVLRKLKDRGLAIVTVMETESIMHNHRPGPIRTIRAASLEKMARETGAQRIITGQITPVNRKKTAIAGGERYACEVMIYRLDDRSITKKTIIINGCDDLYAFFQSVTDKTAEYIREASL